MRTGWGWRGTQDLARATAYVLVEVVLGVAWAGVLLLLLMGGLLLLLWIGIPIIVGALAAARGLAGAERWAARSLRGAIVASPPSVRRLRGTSRQVRGLLGAPSTRRALGYGAARVGITVPVLALVALAGFVALMLAALPFSNGLVQTSGWASQAGWASWWGPLVAAYLVLMMVLGCRALAVVFVRLAELLAPPQSELLRRQLEATEAESRLAAELHDGVGHAVTVMVLQAGVARRLLTVDPVYAEQALAGIESHGRQALDGLDAALSALGASVSGRAQLDLEDDRVVPAARADALAALVNGVRAVGQQVSCSLDVDPQHLSSATWDIAYAVTREGLTNALRHAAGAMTEVRWMHTGDYVVEVRTGPGGRASVGRGGGRGLAVLRRRVRASGGSMESIACADGGYCVRATLPVAASERSQA